MRLSRLAAAALALWPLCAQASSDADTARHFGLIGVWALDCYNPATINNPYVTFKVAADGTVFQSLDAETIEPSDRLHDLHLAGNMLSLKMDSADKITRNMVFKMDNGRLQSWSSARAPTERSSCGTERASTPATRCRSSGNARRLSHR